MGDGPRSHEHDAGLLPPPDAKGRPVDGRLLAEYLGAVIQACNSCQDVHLTLMIEDPATTARLIELACVSMKKLAGGLTPDLLDDAVPGPASPEFRRLARIGSNRNNDQMWAECETMSPAERRAAVNTAADLLVGYLTIIASD
ncbi:hypothetical protein ACFV9C_42900 [Kribbella sp. NPDC059898]|uniref:hypothetical protein n=1 Tax=Kribbella sp. NPDC059898 TaxID=3346995 RepID=UPI0036664536